jgi:hypothetical protein
MPSFTNISVSTKTSDGAVKSAKGWVMWIAVSAAGTGGAFQINDSTDDGGTDKLDITVAANTMMFMDFTNAPIECQSGIYADIPGTNLKVNVGYV